jgi:alkanesulfonate monooxygenase
VVEVSGKQAILNLFMSNLHRGSWRELGTDPEQWINFELWKWLAQTAERGKLHSLFVADVAGIPYSDITPDVLRRSASLLRPEPLALGAALSACTDRIGIVLTASTTYHHPYNIARYFAMLDHMSGGRAGWNIVTSHMAGEQANFGLERPIEHARRYEQAQEFYDVVTGLWDSWDDDAFVRDQESGIYVDPDKLHVLDHEGEFFSVAGPLNTTRPPQGYPVIAQAGASPDGRAFASRVAEVMFTLQQDYDTARAFYTQMRDQVAAAGREPDQIKILPMLQLVVGVTDAEAEAKREELNDLVDPVIGLSILQKMLDFDLSDYPLDGPLPDIPAVTERAQTRQQFVIEAAVRDNLTIRQLARWVGGGGTAVSAGSPTSIADHIEQWVGGDACDGFNLTFADPQVSLPKFVDHVIPELQRRGLFRKDYGGGTLRDNLGLQRPSDVARRQGAGSAGAAA